ncbi:MAG: FAD-dependent oxidoreductase [Cellvibrionales bacterium]|nr:FAD-dependent oxidoreductase [Cellvibrionales bacterium]
MALLDIVILGANLNALSIAVDAATRGFSVALLDPTNLNSQISPDLPMVGSEFMTSGEFNPWVMIQNLQELKILSDRGPELCRWVRAECLPLSQNVSLKQRAMQHLLNRLETFFNIPNVAPSNHSSPSHLDCIIQTEQLMESTRLLAEKKGVHIETRCSVLSINPKGKIWALSYNNAASKEKKITMRAVINCTGLNSLNIAEKWFGYSSRCQVNQTWQHILTYKTQQPIDQIYYLSRANEGDILYFPIQHHLVMATQITAQNSSTQDLFKNTQQVINKHNLPQLTQDNLKAQFIVPSMQIQLGFLNQRKDYVIDFLCPEGTRPLVNVLGGHSSQSRLIAERAINALTDYLPARADCQTRQLRLPTI